MGLTGEGKKEGRSTATLINWQRWADGKQGDQVGSFRTNLPNMVFKKVFAETKIGSHSNKYTKDLRVAFFDEAYGILVWYFFRETWYFF